MKKTRDFNPFNRVRVDTPNTNLFDLSYDNKLTLDMGKLYPVLVQETLPGDSFTITPEMLIRFAPLTFPIMHRIDATIHFFYVPNRILWENWEYFLANEDFHPPYFQETGVGNQWTIEPGSIWDYLGLPLADGMKEKISAFPLFAYARICNEYYMDQNNDSTFIEMRDRLKALSKMNGLIEIDDILPGDTNYSAITMNNRSWEHDYFTSALPFSQKGDSVSIPITLGEIPTVASYTTLLDGVTEVPDGATYKVAGTGASILGVDTVGGIDGAILHGNTVAGEGEINGTINQLRVAMQLQKFLEKNARSGTRYPELIRAHFGVDVGDARISRPEYLGGIQNNVVISEVLQTSQTSGDSALGDYAGYASSVVGGNTIHAYTPEHGFIMGILSVKPRTAYFQGINKKFTRMGLYDYYWQEFAHIGEQAILNKEIYYNELDVAENDKTFGYIPRYSEYKYTPSEVHGDFRTTMLDFHLARNFASPPALNEEFIYVNDDKRIFAVTDPDQNSLYAHIFFDIKAKRKIPFFTDPGGL